MNPGERDEYGHPIAFAAYTRSFSTSLTDLSGAGAGMLIDYGDGANDTAAAPQSQPARNEAKDGQREQGRKKAARGSVDKGVTFADQKSVEGAIDRANVSS